MPTKPNLLNFVNSKIIFDDFDDFCFKIVSDSLGWSIKDLTEFLNVFFVKLNFNKISCLAVENQIQQSKETGKWFLLILFDFF